MTMQFRQVKSALVTLIGDAADAGDGDRYRTIGYQPQAQAAVRTLDSDRSVQVFYRSGDLPKSGGSPTGPFKHDLTFSVELTASKATEGDLSTLENSGSTDLQRATALAGFQKAAALADDSLDELIDIIFQVIQRADNLDLGHSSVVANRWLSDIRKNEISERGEFVIATASMTLTATVSEDVEGLAVLNLDDEGALLSTEIDTTLKVTEDDDEGKAGTFNENPAS